MGPPAGAASTHDRGADEGRLVRRSRFVAGAIALGGAAVAAGLVAGGPSTTRAASADAEALDLLLTVESTEDAFYSEAVRRGGLSGELRRYAEQVAEQEREHLEVVRKALGRDPRRKLEFDFGDATRDPDRFARTAAELEDLAVAAYNGQATGVSAGTLAVAATIVSVEARHAAWIRSIVGKPPAADATDSPMSAAQVLDGLSRIGLSG